MRSSVLRSMVALVLLGICTAPAAAPGFLVEIQATSLHVRQLPTVRSPVIGVLEEGERIWARPALEPGWLMVLTETEAPGYISSNYVSVLENLERPDMTPIQADPAMQACAEHSDSLRLQVEDISFNCDPAAETTHYQGCAARYAVAVGVDCDLPMRVTVACEIEFSYKLSGQWFEQRAIRAGDVGIDVRSGRGAGELALQWQPAEDIGDLVAVRLSDGVCEITDVAMSDSRGELTRFGIR